MGLILFVVSCAHVPGCIEAATFAKVVLAAEVLCTSKSMQPNAISKITTAQLSSFMSVSLKVATTSNLRPNACKTLDCSTYSGITFMKMRTYNQVTWTRSKIGRASCRERVEILLGG